MVGSSGATTAATTAATAAAAGTTTTTTAKKPLGYECIDCDGCGTKNPRMNCGRCKLVYYCGRDCQKRHWNTHKVDCIPVDIMRAKAVGEFVTAAAQTEAQPPGTAQPPPTRTPLEALNPACGICRDEPMTNPVTLYQCFHSFCSDCLECWNKHNAGSPGTPPPCPICQKADSTVEKDLNEAIVQDALLYVARADKTGIDPEERQRLCELALEELNKILSTNEEHLPALCAKAQTLAICDPHQALALYKTILEIDKEGSNHLRKMNNVLDKVRSAMDTGNEEEAEHLLDVCEQLTNAGGRQQQIGEGLGRLLDIHLHIAEVHEVLEDWTSAYNSYKELMDELDDGSVGTPPQHLKIMSGTSRCLYHLGQYDRAIMAAKAALLMNRHFPGVHQLLARPLHAQGKLDEARIVMARAILYEAPWDDVNRQAQIAFRKELEMEVAADA